MTWVILFNAVVIPLTVGDKMFGIYLIIYIIGMITIISVFIYWTCKYNLSRRKKIQAFIRNINLTKFNARGIHWT